MRIALAGKGGAGKTTISATLARLLTAQSSVVAVDADSNPNLATALGLAPDAVTARAVLSPGMVSRRLDGAALTSPLDTVLDTHAIVGADGVRLVLMGSPAHAGEGCLCSAHATVSALLADLGQRPDTVTIIDMEASPEHLSRGTARNVDTLLLVTEPYYRSLEASRLLGELARGLPIPRVGVVANKVRSADDVAAVEQFCQRHDLEMIATVPRSEAVLDADTAGVPLLDRVRRGPPGTDGADVIDAISALADRLLTSAPTRG